MQHATETLDTPPVTNWLQRRWFAHEPAPMGLRPLAGLYGSVAARRRARLQERAVRLPLPVIVVGNITLGGTGKTPFVIWLVEKLREWGWNPGVVSRGYGGHPPSAPFRVTRDTHPLEGGDEPVLIAWRTGVPVVVDPDRVRAASLLIAGRGVDIIVSDDGLQHYRLARDLEICVVDGRRGLGNGALLPAGPLREPATRLDEVALIVANGGGFTNGAKPVIDMRLEPGDLVPLGSGTPVPLEALKGEVVHAVAGIGDPERFFTMLEQHGLEIERHPFPDHHEFTRADLYFDESGPVVMTEKDAVKCRRFGGGDRYALPVTAAFDAEATRLVQQSIARLKP